MKHTNNGEDYYEQQDDKQDEEKAQTNDRFVEKNGLRYEKLYDGAQGIYVWEVTHSKNK